MSNKSVGKKELKGFDAEEVYSLTNTLSNQSASPKGMNECPECRQILSLEVNNLGHFVFVCRSCCSVIEFEEKAVA